MKCVVCEQRKGKRYCPAKGKSICPRCCGEKRGIEINCPLDCPFFIEGQRYHQQRVTRQRIKHDGIESFIRRSELYNQNPEMFTKIETTFLDLYNKYNKLTNDEISSGLELVIMTLDTEKKGIIYEHKSDDRIANDISFQLISGLRDYMDRNDLGQKRITVNYAKEVVNEFLNEVRFYKERESDPYSYIFSIVRYNQGKRTPVKSSDSLIITS